LQSHIGCGVPCDARAGCCVAARSTIHQTTCVPRTVTITILTTITTMWVFVVCVPLLRPPSRATSQKRCLRANSFYQEQIASRITERLRFLCRGEGIEKAQGDPVRTESKQRRRAYTKPTTGVKPVCGFRRPFGAYMSTHTCFLIPSKAG